MPVLARGAVDAAAAVGGRTTEFTVPLVRIVLVFAVGAVDAS